MDFVSQVVADAQMTQQKMIDAQYNNLSCAVEALELRMLADISSVKAILGCKEGSLEQYSPQVDKLLRELQDFKDMTNAPIDKLTRINDDLLFIKNTIKIDSDLCIIDGKYDVNNVHRVLNCEALLAHQNQNKFSVFYNFSKEKLSLSRTDMVFCAVKIFNKLILIKKNIEAGGEVITRIEFNSKSNELKSVFQTLLLLDRDHLIEFSKKIFNVILLLLLKKCKVSVSSNTLVISHDKSSSVMSPQSFVCKFNDVFGVLIKYLNVGDEGGANLLKFIGQQCSDKFTSLLVENFLCRLNGNWEVMSEFYSLVQDLKAFGFMRTGGEGGSKNGWEYMTWPVGAALPECASPASLYLSDDQDNYVVKSSIISYTDRAVACIKQNILTTSLVESIRIEPPESWNLSDMDVSSNYLTACVGNDSSGGAAETSIILPSEDILLFPQCRVSESIEELAIIISQIFGVKDTYKSQHESEASELRNAASERRNAAIVSQYNLLIQQILSFYLFHKRHDTSDSAESSAIIYNNSMYLVSKLIAFGCSSTNPFIRPLEYHGLDTFNSGIVSERDRLRSFLDLRCKDEVELPADWTECVSDALSHLQLLKRCWCRTLPRAIYHQALGYLCNYLLEQIMAVVKQSKHDERVMRDVKDIEHHVVLTIANLFLEADREMVFGDYIKELDNFRKLSLGSESET